MISRAWAMMTRLEHHSVAHKKSRNHMPQRQREGRAVGCHDGQDTMRNALDATVLAREDNRIELHVCGFKQELDLMNPVIDQAARWQHFGEQRLGFGFARLIVNGACNVCSSLKNSLADRLDQANPLMRTKGSPRNLGVAGTLHHGGRGLMGGRTNLARNVRRWDHGRLIVTIVLRTSQQGTLALALLSNQSIRTGQSRPSWLRVLLTDRTGPVARRDVL